MTAIELLNLLLSAAAIAIGIAALLREPLQRGRLRRIDVELADLDQDVERLSALIRSSRSRENVAKARDVRASQLSKEDQLLADAEAALSAPPRQAGEVASAPPADKDAIRRAARPLLVKRS